MGRGPRALALALALLLAAAGGLRGAAGGGRGAPEGAGRRVGRRPQAAPPPPPPLPPRNASGGGGLNFTEPVGSERKTSIIFWGVRLPQPFLPPPLRTDSTPETRPLAPPHCSTSLGGSHAPHA